MLFFTLCLKTKDNKILKLYDTVVEDRFILIQYEDSLVPNIIHINQNTSNEMHKSLLNKTVGDTVLVKIPVTGIPKKVIIRDVMNKFMALYKELHLEAANPLESDLPLTSFTKRISIIGIKARINNKKLHGCIKHSISKINAVYIIGNKILTSLPPLPTLCKIFATCSFSKGINIFIKLVYRRRSGSAII